MYKGKFDAKAKGQQAPADTLENILKERNEAIAQRAARQAERPHRSAAPAAQRPARPAAGQPQRAPRPQDRRPARTEMEKVQPPKKRGPRTGGVVFYSMYFFFIFAFFVGIFGVLTWLNGWLHDYEAAQPTVKCQQVFDELFGNPDWEQLYRLSGTEDTIFEGAPEYAIYMTDKVGNQELNFVETSAGLQGVVQHKKYIVRLGKEKIATFTLEGRGEKITSIPDWQLMQDGGIELFINRNQSITVRKMEDHVVFVNGIELSDDYTIQIGSTRADEYLPAGTPTVRTSVQQLNGLMAPPQMVVYDRSGTNRVEVTYNPDTGMYEEQNDAIVMSDEERNAIFGALESYAGFMINASGSRAGVAKYFDGGSQIYADILKMGSELWMNADKGHEFVNKEVQGYTKYSDTLFSVRASMVMVATGKDGSKLEFPVKESMFFTKKNGTWVCYDMTNADITEPVGQVRLTFCDESGKIISTGFFDTEAKTLVTPPVQVPAGKVFSGWSSIEAGEDNVKTWNIVFRPDEAGNVTVTHTLEPMTLYPLFENA